MLPLQYLPLQSFSLKAPNESILKNTYNFYNGKNTSGSLLISGYNIIFSFSRQVPYNLAITHVSLFDSETKKVLPNKTVLIKADTFSQIVNSEKKTEAKTIIERKGKLVNSGFIDTHIHLTDII